MSSRVDTGETNPAPGEAERIQIKRAYPLAHGARLAALGAWAMMFDTTCLLLTTSVSVLQRAEARGLRMEDEVLKRYHHPDERTSQEVVNRRDRMQEDVLNARRSVAQELTKRGKASEDEVERQIKVILARLGMPRRERLQKLGAEIDALTTRINRRLATDPAGLAGVLPIKDYDRLSVKKIMARLDPLDIEELNAVRTYEKKRLGRVTLLRELDARIAAFSKTTGA